MAFCGKCAAYGARALPTVEFEVFVPTSVAYSARSSRENHGSQRTLEANALRVPSKTSYLLDGVPWHVVEEPAEWF